MHELPEKWNLILSLQPIIAGNGQQKEKTKYICWIHGVTLNAEYPSELAVRFSWEDCPLPLYVYLFMVLYYLKCRHRRALPDSTESSLLMKQDTWIFLMTVLLFKFVFLLKAMHSTWHL